ncbi:hypothetical protein HDU84_000448 [Entophlyctis sp. JEL0112]|nr:hypothetical protein HDU84_000448 [Entophlyctis sp. JEL0112]
MKILTTAIFSVSILKKSLTKIKWCALIMLTVGIALVQLPDEFSFVQVQSDVLGPTKTLESIIGLLAVTIACFLSGLAGVWFEKVLKDSSASIWHRNIQMSVYSIIPGLVSVFVLDYSIISEHGFFVGYNKWTIMTIATQAVGGLIVALVVKYADNILKGFATSISVILSALASVYLFNFKISKTFVLGSLLVLWATHIYGRPPGGDAANKQKDLA